MRWILDACTLIYLIKADLFSRFITLTEYSVVIDSSVYQEVVINGKAGNFPDASTAEIILNEFKIPVISIDVSEELTMFHDPGEASCYILAKEEGVCLTTDIRAFKKFLNAGQKVMRLDTFYFEKLNQNQLTKTEFISILKKLESINATNPKSLLFFMEKLLKMNEVDTND